MTRVRDILASKGPQIHSISPRDTVLDAALRMNEHKIGSLAVLERGALIGILTERDLLSRVIVERRDPVSTQVEDVMTCEVICCLPSDDLDDVRCVMKARRIRHLPVKDDDGHLLGMISIGDLNATHARKCEATIQVMEDYIAGRV